MEYTQLTIADWLEMKANLKKELIAASASFVRIGYMLRKIQDGELYKADGYKSVADFAEAECGLTASAVSRFMAINRKYSIDGYSDRLCTEYAQLGQSKLAEMLTLPDNDMELIRPETERSTIRELKNFNRTEPAPEQVSNINRLIEEFFRGCREELTEIYRPGGIYQRRDVKALAELLNPAGNRVFRKGMFMLFLYSDVLKIKKFGSDPRNMEWEDFFDRMAEIFRNDAAADVWASHYGEEPEEAADDKREEAEDQKAQKADEGTGQAESPEGHAAKVEGPDRGAATDHPGRHEADGPGDSTGDGKDLPAAGGTEEDDPGEGSSEGRDAEDARGSMEAASPDNNLKDQPEEVFAPAQKSEESPEIKASEEVSEAPEEAAETIYYAGDTVIIRATVISAMDQRDGGGRYAVKLPSGPTIWVGRKDITGKESV